ncbi:hypothetical protein [Alloprevotella rava]|uniref:Uncharacterized protein n=1 Tax=Alloprevotella rava TaxID=671218 RepID=A0A7W5UDJ4_9BACT|nr:hypothetical protein [Alloprevotella rava]MBB3702063.1 hypothetical protein [Alloprevotella rava]
MNKEKADSYFSENILIPLAGFLIASADTIRKSADSLIVFSNAIRIFSATLERKKGKDRETHFSIFSSQEYN